MSFNGVELDFLEDSEVLFAVHFKIHRVDIGRVNQFVDLLLVYNEVNCFGSAVSVLLFAVITQGRDLAYVLLLWLSCRGRYAWYR